MTPLRRLWRVRETVRSRSSQLRSPSSAGISGRTRGAGIIRSSTDRTLLGAQILLDLWHRGDWSGDCHHFRRHRPFSERSSRSRASSPGGLLVEAHWSLAPSIVAGLLVGGVSGLLISVLVIAVQLPPFMPRSSHGHRPRGRLHPDRGTLFRRLSVVSHGWRPLGIPSVVASGGHDRAGAPLSAGNAPPAVGASGLLVGGNETAALFSGISLARIKTSVYLISATLAAVSGVVLALVQGQGKADLAGLARHHRLGGRRRQAFRAGAARSSAPCWGR